MTWVKLRDENGNFQTANASESLPQPVAIAWLLLSEFESYFVLKFQSFCIAMYPSRIHLGGSS